MPEAGNPPITPKSKVKTEKLLLLVLCVRIYKQYRSTYKITKDTEGKEEETVGMGEGWGLQGRAVL